MSLRGNGLKVLTANNFIPSQTPIIECRGKYMLGSGNHRYIVRFPPEYPVFIPCLLGLAMLHTSCPILSARTWRLWWMGKRMATTPATADEPTQRLGRPTQLYDITWTRAVCTCTSSPAGTSTGTRRSFCLLLRLVFKGFLWHFLQFLSQIVKNGSLSMDEELQQMRRAEVRAATLVNGTSER